MARAGANMATELKEQGASTARTCKEQVRAQ